MRKGKEKLRSLKNPVIDSYLAIYETVEKEIKKMEREIEQEGRRYEEVKLLTGLKGIGVYSALIIFPEIGNGSRFPAEEKLFSYAELVPKAHQSGKESYYGRITKEGWIKIS